MLKQEIIEKITKYFKLTHFEAEKIYDDIFQSIMQGVKDDNITDVGNLGEFIIKYNENNNGGYKKTVEFLPSTNLEDELNQSSAEYRPLAIEPENIEEPTQEISKEVQPEKTEFEETKQVVDEIPPPEKIVNILPEEKSEQVHTESSLSVEEELERKREEIIKKLTPQHQEEYHHLLHVDKGLPLNVPKPIVIKDPVYREEIEAKEKESESKTDEIKELKEEVKEVKEEIQSVKEEIQPVKEEIQPVKEEIKRVKEEITEEVKDKAAEEKESVDELTNKSFSDYFTELKTSEGISKHSTETVIPPTAVDLHKEIVGEQTPPPPPPPIPPVPEKLPEPVEQAAPFVKQNGNGYSAGSDFQKKDDSYYIWYKDSEPNAIDTQTMSYEYELLYQATKEAEYKSKLRIYVTTFILFFSIVLLLLIFSPVIYKYFFNPEEEQTIEQTVPDEQSTTTEDNNSASITPPAENNTSPPATANEQKTADQKPPVQENKDQQTEQKTGQQPSNQQKTGQSETPETKNTTPNIQGVVKTGIGWMDEKNRVIYVQLESGKFTIQESAWESEEKANKRINIVADYNIAGMKGSIYIAELGSKGKWYRVRFGEFTTIEEAKQKAEELRNKEKIKLQAFLFSILMMT